MATLLLILIWIVGVAAFVLQGRGIYKKRAQDPDAESQRQAAPKANIGIWLESAGFFLAWFRWPAPHPDWLNAVAIGIALLSGIFAQLAIRELGMQWRVQAVVTKHHKLITTGPYSIVRNPIYTALLGMLIATGLIMVPFPLILLGVVLYVVGTEIRVKEEEKLLLAKFGEEFEAYRRRVPAYIPFVR
jgi:protein-S-isoprenylcysteine O-methyltransferase Ste14